MITIIGIINGVDICVDIDENKMITSLRKLLCKESNNTGRPFSEWQIHNDKGQELSPRWKISKYLKHRDIVFFNLGVGAGGSFSFA